MNPLPERSSKWGKYSSHRSLLALKLQPVPLMLHTVLNYSDSYFSSPLTEERHFSDKRGF